MDIEQVREYILSLFGVSEDQPFGEDLIAFRIEGKIFMCLWLGSDRWKTIKNSGNNINVMHFAIKTMLKSPCKERKANELYM